MFEQVLQDFAHSGHQNKFYNSCRWHETDVRILSLNLAPRVSIPPKKKVKQNNSKLSHMNFFLCVVWLQLVNKFILSGSFSICFLCLLIPLQRIFLPQSKYYSPNLHTILNDQCCFIWFISGPVLKSVPVWFDQVIRQKV